MTVADFAVLPTSLPTGEVRYELDDGKVVVMAPPGYDHARRQLKIVHYLLIDGEERGHGVACAEVGIVLRRNPDRVVGADAAFILTASLPVRSSTEGYLETIPELVVEVRSKNDTRPELASKREEYFDAGVKLVWIIDSNSSTVTAHERGQPDRVFSETETLTCPLIPGFAVPVSKLFTGS